jgi:hypothetical protein
VFAQELASDGSTDSMRSDLSLEPDAWDAVDSPDATEQELDRIYEPRRGMFDSPLRGVTDPVLKWRQDLYDQTGLRIGFRYITQTQHASGGPGNRTGAADDIDLMFDWTLLGRGTRDTGRLVFTAEERYRLWYADITPNALRGEIGSLAGTTGAFNDRGLVVRDAFWDQRLLDAKVRVLVGRAAPDDYAGTHRFQSSVMGFFNGNLSGNITMPWPGHGPLALVAVHPTDEFYITAATSNANSRTTEISISSLDDFELFTFGEVGYSPMINGVGRALITLTGWYMPERDDGNRPDDAGFSVTYQQNFGDRFWAMGRYGYASEGLTGVESVWQAAVAVEGLLGHPANVTGIGIAYTEPSNSNQREETSIDSFHRFQLTGQTELSFGAQAIFNPGNEPNDDVIGVFSIRLNFTL